MIRIRAIARVVWLEMLRRKDLYVLLILLGALLAALLSVNAFGLGAVVRYLIDVGLLFAWVFSVILTVGLAGRQLPQEESRRTIYPLLAKPVTRREVLLGKWLGAWSAAAAATLLFYALVLGVALARGARFDPACLAEAVLLHLTALAAIAALTLALTTRLTGDAATTLAYVVCAAALTIAPSAPRLLAKAEGFAAGGLLALYYALPHFELFDLRQRLTHDWGPAPGGTVAAVLAYGAVWTALFLLLAWMGYRRKRFRRGESA